MNDEIVGLIPAAGRGTRLKLPYPKELYPIISDKSYKPVSQFILENLIRADVRHSIFVINETKHQLMGYFGCGGRFGCSLSYVVQESNESAGSSTSPGLAHALDSAYHLTKGKTVYFGMADTIMRPTDVFARARETSSPGDDAILVLFPTTRPEKFGMVRVAEDKRVVEIVDKPRKTDLVEMWGCMIWKPRFTEYLHESIRKHNIGDFAVIMNNAIRDGLQFRGIRVGDSYTDFGTYEEILEAKELVDIVKPAK